MKVYIANNSSQKIGGGWSWIANFKKVAGELITEDYDEADIYLVASASMISREEAEKAKRDGKKFILRTDNILRNSRNRNTGMSRMKSFVEMADEVVFQSQWARDMLYPYLLRTGPVIHNSCDTSIFNMKGREENEDAQFIYSRVNRDETKNWEMARFMYQEEAARRSNHCLLNIVGAYSPELIEYNFDFYNGELYNYWHVVSDPQFMANLYKKSDYLIYPFFNDACSNTLIEALCSGCQVLDNYHMADTGGANEILHHWHEHNGPSYFGLDRMHKEYEEVFKSVI